MEFGATNWWFYPIKCGKAEICWVKNPVVSSIFRLQLISNLKLWPSGKKIELFSRRLLQRRLFIYSAYIFWLLNWTLWHLLGVCTSILRCEKGDKRDCPFNRQSRVGVLYGERFYSKSGRTFLNPTFLSWAAERHFYSQIEIQLLRKLGLYTYIFWNLKSVHLVSWKLLAFCIWLFTNKFPPCAG